MYSCMIDPRNDSMFIFGDKPLNSSSAQQKVFVRTQRVAHDVAYVSKLIPFYKEPETGRYMNKCSKVAFGRMPFGYS